MKCKKCGANINQGEKFCSKCGASLKPLDFDENATVFVGNYNENNMCDTDDTVFVNTYVPQQNNENEYITDLNIGINNNNRVSVNEDKTEYIKADETVFVGNNLNDNIYSENVPNMDSYSNNIDESINNPYNFFNPDSYSLSSKTDECAYEENSLSITQWFFSIVLQFIPIVGLIFLIAWAYGIKQKGLENFSKAMLILRALIDITALGVVVYFMITDRTVIDNLFK